MAVNLTPQYLDAEAEYKKAQTPEEKLACLKKMWTLVPKHKASEKLQAELKSKMSELKDQIEQIRAHPKKAGISYKFPKQGAGQYVILGAANAGKSRLLTRLTRAAPAVAPYPFTTHEPTAGMMDWEDVKVQLIDTPPITADVMEGWLSSIVRAADAALLMVDLGDDDCPFAAETVIERLAQVKTELIGQPPAEEADAAVKHVKTLLVANKIDVEGAQDRLDIVKEMFGPLFAIHVISAEHGQGLEDLRMTLYKSLNVIRVYTKQPGKPPDLTSPFTCKAGSTLVEMAALVHRDFAEKLKSARIWGTGVHDGQAVGRDHVMQDKDVVELHI
ncbi:MAG: 50S ribosome-binding GTPase [Gemmataceae bacterium]|nr:50S ribosome-binding GTPase [Gemmataceae bacterium]